MHDLKLFVPITKVDAVKGIVYGVLAAEEPDRAGEIFDYVGSKPHFEKWSGDISKATDGKSVGNLRAMHGTIAAGKFTDMGFNDDAKRIEVAAKVVDKNELEKVLEGVYTGFSIGGKYIKRWDDPAQKGLKRYIAEPYEGSLVDLPCIASATFEIIKEGGAIELRKFHVPPAEPKEPTNDEVVAKANELAKAAGKAADWLSFVEPARAELKKVAAPAPGAPPAEQHASDDDAGWEQVWTHPKLPGKSFAKKADLRAALVDKDAADAAAKAAKPVTDALKGITDALALKEAKPTMLDIVLRPLSGDVPDAVADGPRKALRLGAVDWARVHKFAVANKEHDLCKALAASGALEVKDGVIETTAGALKALDTFVPAILAEVNKAEAATAKGLELAGQGKAMKDGSFAIEAAADIAAAVKAAPTAKNKTAARRHIIRRAKALGALSSLPETWVSKATQAERLESGELAKALSLYGLSSLVSLLAQVESAEESCEMDSYWSDAVNVPKALKDRFGTMVVEFGDMVAALLDVLLTDIKAEEADEAVNRAAVAIDLGRLSLLKAGARHSKVDQRRLNDAHDLLVDAGASCEAMEEDESAGKVAGLRKQLVAQDAAFTKTLGDLSEVIKGIAASVKRIEDTPLPMGTSSVTTHEKGQEQPGPGLKVANRDAYVEVAGEMTRLLIGESHRAPMTNYPGR